MSFSLIRSEVSGPAPVSFPNNFFFFFLFIDDPTQTTWVYLMRNKNEVFNHFKVFLHPLFLTSLYSYHHSFWKGKFNIQPQKVGNMFEMFQDSFLRFMVELFLFLFFFQLVFYVMWEIDLNFRSFWILDKEFLFCALRWWCITCGVFKRSYCSEIWSAHCRQSRTCRPVHLRL